ncbi:hypothetical protein [Planotetraspora sp. GP83]|uniref:hypothetical protein n=1 Tax=Planotetraspora sp. GP83 TaxID=3156264 RepID=UPI003519D4E7
MSPRLEDAPTDVIPVIVADTLVPGGVSAAPGLAAPLDGRMPPLPRPWRRIVCWAMLGHFYYPGADGCLECGKLRPDLRKATCPR